MTTADAHRLEEHRKPLRLLAAESGGLAVVNGVLTYIIHANRPKPLLGRSLSILAQALCAAYAIKEAGACVNMFRLVNRMQYESIQTAWTFPVVTVLRGPVDYVDDDGIYWYTDKPRWVTTVWPVSRQFRSTTHMLNEAYPYTDRSDDN